MEKLFIVATGSGATKEQRDAFTASMKGTALGFWHQIENTWLIADPNGTLTPRHFRDQLKESMPGIATLVIQVVPVDWSTFSPERDHQWLHDALDAEDRWMRK